jgi:two-component system LytT family sensor kinase
MKDFINKAENVRRVEFWAITAVFVFAVFFLVTTPVQSNYHWSPNKGRFEEENIAYNYYVNYFFPQLVRYTVLYLSFLLLNFYVVPRLIRKEGTGWNIVTVLIVTAFLGTVLGVTDTYLKTYLFFTYGDDTYVRIFENSFAYALWLVMVFGFYTIIKYTGIYLLSHSEQIHARYKFLTPAVLTTFVIWSISVFILLVSDVGEEGLTGWILFSLSGIVLFLFSVRSLIPLSVSRRKPLRHFFLRILLIATITILPVSLFAMIFFRDDDPAFAFGFFNSIFHLFVTAPVAWVVCKRQMKGNEEIFYLKKELGQTHANFDFLRSQINPHFLFNALNTIYGTAIQENAHRTGEGIEKLGDMMRFMLQENMQEKIPLSREIEYLNNYIGLQRLRTDGNATVEIDTRIEEPVNIFKISPMLLIPFVENAFKHGISFREPSRINVILELKDDTLYFDVFNTKHEKQEHDPEKYKSGIGLNNVKERLHLLYRDKHELIVRETSREYFVHLTIQLS